jgi:hypothetical protein
MARLIVQDSVVKLFIMFKKQLQQLDVAVICFYVEGNKKKMVMKKMIFIAK